MGGVPAKLISKGPLKLLTDRTHEIEIIRHLKKGNGAPYYITNV